MGRRRPGAAVAADPGRPGRRGLDRRAGGVRLAGRRLGAGRTGASTCRSCCWSAGSRSGSCWPCSAGLLVDLTARNRAAAADRQAPRGGARGLRRAGRGARSRRELDAFRTVRTGLDKALQVARSTRPPPRRAAASGLHRRSRRGSLSVGCDLGERRCRPRLRSWPDEGGRDLEVGDLDAAVVDVACAVAEPAVDHAPGRRGAASRRSCGPGRARRSRRTRPWFAVDPLAGLAVDASAASSADAGSWRPASRRSRAAGRRRRG